MTYTHFLRGVQIPEAGDKILPGLGEIARTTGSIRAVDSVAAARSILTGAESVGLAPSPQYPAYFDIGGIIYRATGTKSSGAWVLGPVNEIEAHVNTTGGGSITREPGAQHALITSSLPMRPYKRIVSAQGMVNASVNGTVGLRLLILNQAGATARWETGAAQQTQTVINSGIVPAGVDPQVILALSFGGTGNSTATISSAADANRLIVEAKPLTMD